MNWTMTAEQAFTFVFATGEVMDAMTRVVAGLRSEPHHVEVDRAALALYFELAPQMTLAAWKRRWIACAQRRARCSTPTTTATALAC
jgi:predicted component of type VI protein secretion system